MGRKNINVFIYLKHIKRVANDSKPCTFYGPIWQYIIIYINNNKSLNKITLLTFFKVKERERIQQQNNCHSWFFTNGLLVFATLQFRVHFSLYCKPSSNTVTFRTNNPRVLKTSPNKILTTLFHHLETIPMRDHPSLVPAFSAFL